MKNVVVVTPGNPGLIGTKLIDWNAVQSGLVALDEAILLCAVRYCVDLGSPALNGESEPLLCA